LILWLIMPGLVIGIRYVSTERCKNASEAIGIYSDLR
jgi:hypothetical protein